MLTKILSSSRYIIIIAVISCFIAAVTLLVLAGVEIVGLVIKAFSLSLEATAYKKLAVNFIEAIDILLLGSVFYITAIGFYELFIDKDLPTPDWLHITHLDDLKSKLIGVVVVILTVAFLGQVVNWDGERNLLSFGVAIAFIILSITLFLGGRKSNH